MYILKCILNSKGEGQDPINRFYPRHICVLVTNQYLDFSTSYGMVRFVFSEWRWKVIVHFVDIYWIVDHPVHCLNFLFLIDWTLKLKLYILKRLFKKVYGFCVYQRYKMASCHLTGNNSNGKVVIEGKCFKCSLFSNQWNGSNWMQTSGNVPSGLFCLCAAGDCKSIQLDATTG